MDSSPKDEHYVYSPSHSSKPVCFWETPKRHFFIFQQKVHIDLSRLKKMT